MVSAAENLLIDMPNIAERVTAVCVHGFAKSAPTYDARTVPMGERAVDSRVPQLECWQQRAADSHEIGHEKASKSTTRKSPLPRAHIPHY